MLEPVKPFTMAGAPFVAPGLASKNLRAAFAVAFIFSAARWRTPRVCRRPDIGGEDGLVPFINQVAHGLADKV